jgi:hypothetical protein
MANNTQDLPASVSGNSSNAQNVQQQPFQFVKFNLPPYTQHDPQTWFNAVDVIFAQNRVQSEIAKFSALLPSFTKSLFRDCKDIID